MAYLPESFSDNIDWTKPGQTQKKILALYCAWQERLGYEPFLSSKKNVCANGNVLSTKLFNVFNIFTDNFNYSKLQAILTDHNIMEQIINAPLVGVLWLNYEYTYWYDMAKATWNADGKIITPFFLTSGTNKNWHTYLLYQCIGYQFNSVGGSNWHAEQINGLLLQLKKLINNMSCLTSRQPRTYLPYYGESFSWFAGDGIEVPTNNEAWRHAFSMSASAENYHHRITAQVSFTRVTYNDSLFIDVECYGIGATKFVNPYPFKAAVYVSASFVQSGVVGDNFWDFGTGLSRGLNYIGDVEPYDEITICDLTLEKLKSTPQFIIASSGDVDSKFEFEIDAVMLSFVNGFKFYDYQAEDYIPLPNTSQ